MRIILFLLLATGVTAGEEKKAPLERLAETGVASPAVGYAGTPSEFYEVFRELRSLDDHNLIVRLIEHENPVFRCMGLNLSVDCGRDRAIRELQRRIGDREAVGLTTGCVLSTTTVGGVAWRLLRQPRVLGAGERDEPLLPAKALLALDLRILARDDTFAIHPEAARTAGPLLGSGAIELPKLRERCPGETDVRLVKALGRVRTSDRTEAFLVRVAGDAKLDPDVRLAALAGIARGGSEEARKSLDAQAALLKGTDLVERTARRIALRKLLHDVIAAGNAPTLALKSEAAVRKGDPSALPALSNVIAEARKNDRPVPKWVTPAFGRIVARAETGFPAWDPDADLRYRLEAFLWMKGPWLRKHAPSKALKEIEARVAKLVAD